MSWRDRDYADDPMRRAGRPGGDWQGVRPTLDNPMSWSVLLGRVWGIAVRVHVIFLLFIAIRLLRSFASPSDDVVRWQSFGLVALDMASLFTIVLLHEFGHCLACRRAGGEADEILMWPLGGLAFCRPGQHWAAHLVTAAGGPLVNVAIFLVLAPVLGLLTGAWWGVAFPNPLGFPAFGQLQVEGVPLLAMFALFSVHSLNLILLLFNLLPIFPLDGGRIVQACLWPKLGYVRSMRLAVYTGYFGAIALFIFGAVTGEWMLIAIAAFGGVTCYMTVRQLEWTESLMGGDDDLYAAARWTGSEVEGGTDAGGRRRDRRRGEERAAEDAAQVDLILAKIARGGMGSLTRREKRLLRRATVRRRQGE